MHPSAQKPSKFHAVHAAGDSVHPVDPVRRVSTFEEHLPPRTGGDILRTSVANKSLPPANRYG